MSILDGQREVSLRRRMLAYCEQHNIAVPTAFHNLEIVYAIALIDGSAPEKLRLVGETFYNVPSVLSWFCRMNKYPANYRVLDFKRSCELVLSDELQLVRGASFDNRKDIDAQY